MFHSNTGKGYSEKKNYSKDELQTIIQKKDYTEALYGWLERVAVDSGESIEDTLKWFITK